LSRKERWRFGALKSDSTHHFFWNACTKSGSLRFWEFSGCWLILSVYILMSFDFCKIVRSSVILLLPLLIVIILEGFSIFWLWSYVKVFQSFDCDHTWRFFNRLIVIVLEGFSIFWLWSYLKVFQSVDCDHTWRFFNLVIVIILEGFPIFWLWSYLKVFQSFDCDHTWRFSNLLIVIILEGFPIFWLWSYLKVFPETRRADLIRYLHVHYTKILKRQFRYHNSRQRIQCNGQQKRGNQWSDDTNGEIINHKSKNIEYSMTKRKRTSNNLQNITEN
jgi:hypothetical protein